MEQSVAEHYIKKFVDLLNEMDKSIVNMSDKKDMVYLLERYLKEYGCKFLAEKKPINATKEFEDWLLKDKGFELDNLVNEEYN